MRTEAPTSLREIDTANGNLFDLSTFYTAMVPAHAMVDGIKEAGYRGFEWHPLRFPILSGAQMNSGLISEGVKEAVVSLHQSYRSEKSLGDALHHPNKALAVVSYMVLPERVASLDDLERIQKVVGRELPVVLYPAREGEESGTARSFDEKTFQPLPEVMKQWGVKTPEELVKATYERGYTGLCVDLLHMRRPAEDGFSLHPWQESLPQLLPHTQELHISAGRFDQQGNPVDTEQELRDLLAGHGTSDLMKMLRMIEQSGWQGRIVTEIPAMQLHALRANKQPFASPKDLIADHKQIVHTIQDILG